MARNKENTTNTIIRTSKRENPYVMIDKFGLNDERLSWKAKGLLAYLLSKPDDWQVYESDLIKHAKDGRDAVRTGLRELENCGYLSRRQIRGENGSFGHMEYIVYERPIIEDTEQKNTADGKSVHGNSPQTENPTTENPLLLNNDLTNNNSTMIDCMSAAAEIAATTNSPSSENLEQEIYQTLTDEIPKNCFYKGLPLSPNDINQIFLMLINQFPNRLAPEAIRIAAGLYFDRACYFDLNAPNGVSMKIDIESSVGFFYSCYNDALKQYKVLHKSKKETKVK